MQDKTENSPIIFAKETLNKYNEKVAFDMDVAEKKLKSTQAHLGATKGCWLIRESSVPGLLTLSFYNKEKKIFQHQRIGFVDEVWKDGPANKEKAIEFAKLAEAAFKSNLPENSSASLFYYLNHNGFSIQNMLRPKTEEATKTSVYSGYIELDDECADESASTTYSPW